MSLCLTLDEVIELTGKQRPTAQARELDSLGIPYRRRQDGSLLLFRADIPNATEKEGHASPAVRLPPPRGVLAG